MRLQLLALSTAIAFCQQGRVDTPPASKQPGAVVVRKTAGGGTTCSIEGEVRNAVTREPIAAAVLTLRSTTVDASSDRSPFVYSARTDERGRFVLDDIESGTYRVEATRTGYLPVEFGAQEGIGAARPVSIAPQARVSGLTIQLTPQAVLAGRVVDERGDPLPYVQIQALQQRYNHGRKQLTSSGGATTNDLGEYRIFGLPPGQYILTAIYPSNAEPSATVGLATDEEYIPVYYPQGTNPALATAIEARPGARLTGIDFVLSKTPSVHLRGRVNNSTGKGIVSVTLVPSEQTRTSGMSRTYVTDSQGRFDIRGISPGTYLLVASLLGAEGPLTVHRHVSLTSNVDDLELTMSGPARLPGRIRVDNNEQLDLASVRVTLQPQRGGTMFGPLPTARAQSDGSFLLSRVSPDEYYVVVTDLPEGYYLKSVRIGEEEVLDTGFNLSGASNNAISVILSSGSGSVDGEVQNARGESAVEATVALVPQGANRRNQARFYRVVTTDERGRFSITGISPGAYKAYAWDDVELDAWMDPDFLDPIETGAKPLSITEQSRQHVELQIVQSRPAK
jgi:protocatechuate 3,4-dioxygenase beta subunit